MHFYGWKSFSVCVLSYFGKLRRMGHSTIPVLGLAMLLPFTFIVVDFLVVALSAIRFRVISLLV